MNYLMKSKSCIGIWKHFQMILDNYLKNDVLDMKS